MTEVFRKTFKFETTKTKNRLERKCSGNKLCSLYQYSNMAPRLSGQTSILGVAFFVSGEQGWRSGQSSRLPPLCSGFDSRTWSHMWVEFVVGSCSCSEGFSAGSLVFLPSQKSTFLNSKSIWNSKATGLSVEDCCVSPSLNKVDLFYFGN